MCRNIGTYLAQPQDLSEEACNELKSIAEWTENYAATLEPLSRLDEVLQEFKRPPNPYGWDDL